jgi:hypothetical protein
MRRRRWSGSKSMWRPPAGSVQNRSLFSICSASVVEEAVEASVHVGGRTVLADEGEGGTTYLR